MAVRGRRPLVTAASALLVVASIAVFASIYTSADHRVPVVFVTSTIHQGQRIIGSDLGTVDVAASGGLSMIPAASASELSGTWAAVTLPAGSLISTRDVTSSRPLAGGNAVVGLSLKDGQLPADGVQPGDEVMIVQTPGTGSALPVGGVPDTSGSGSGPVASSGVLVARSTVFASSVPAPSSASGASELVSVEVPSTVAAAVASASSASQVSLVLLPDTASVTSDVTSGGGIGGGRGSS